MPVTAVAPVRFAHAATGGVAPQQQALPVAAPDTFEIRFGHTAEAEVPQERPADVMQAFSLVAELAAAFKKNPDVLFPKGFDIRRHVNRGYYNDGFPHGFFPATLRLGNLLSSSRAESLSHVLAKWARHVMPAHYESIMFNRDVPTVPVDEVFNLHATLPDGRNMTIVESVDLDDAVLARARQHEYVKPGEGYLGHRITLTVSNGKKAPTEIVIDNPEHVRDLSRDVSRILHGFVTWKQDAETQARIEGDMDDIILDAALQQSACMDCKGH